ncbi:MAG: LPS assembly lipoprotein LptE [Candidatus Omnitrophica bacterium]|nr:LPS assembly lipoprotein LptE [Candidatus Omnitrophota bacterium]
MKKILVAVAILTFTACGCGYTTKSLLPSNYKTIYVGNFKNAIKITAEQSNERMYRGYRPGMEIKITKAVIDKYLIDGNLRIDSPGSADLILSAELIDFNRGGIIYDTNDNVEEYRIKLVVSMELTEAKTGKTVWKEPGFAGETTYRPSGGLEMSENAAIDAAIADLAKRIVERTVEAW